MKKALLLFLLATLLWVSCAASAEELTLDLRGIRSAELEEITALIDMSSDVTLVDLTGVPLAVEDCVLLRERYPDVRFLWEMDVFGVSVTADTTVLDFGEKNLSDFDLLAQYLRCFPNLEQVIMYKTVMRQEERETLCEAFPDIFFGLTLRFQNQEYTVRSGEVTAFSTLKNGAPPYMNNDHLWWVKYCRRLKALDLGHNTISDLSFLYEAPQLKVLILACNKIEDLTPLACQTELEYLELFINEITDVTPLGGLKNLKDLNLSFNAGITDITPLYDLPNLERLWLSWDKEIPQEQIDRLYELYPDAEIVLRSYGSTGDIELEDGTTAPGWREHPRYPVIYHMFNHGEFVEMDWDFHDCYWCERKFAELFP